MTSWLFALGVAAAINASDGLVESSTVVAHFEAHDSIRFLSLLDVPASFAPTCEGEAWLVAKLGRWPQSTHDQRTVVFADCDAKLRVCTDKKASCVHSARAVTMDADVANKPSASANLAAVFVNSSVFVGIGGRLRASGQRAVMLGANDRGGALSSRQPTLSRLFDLFDPADLACVEARRKTCDFDGRFSAVEFRGRLYVYARANSLPEGGGRYVQVTSIRRDALLRGPGGSMGWSKFKLATFGGRTNMTLPQLQKLERGSWTKQESQAPLGEIYAAAITVNPLDPTTLVGLFPVVKPKRTFALAETASISLALSCDGVHFSELKPILRANVGSPRGEIADHPVDGLLYRADQLFFYVHHDVPGTSLPNSTRDSDPRVARYTLNIDTFREYMKDAVAHLPGCVASQVLEDDKNYTSLPVADGVFPSLTRPDTTARASQKLASSFTWFEDLVARLIIFFVIEAVIVYLCLRGWPDSLNEPNPPARPLGRQRSHRAFSR